VDEDGWRTGRRVVEEVPAMVQPIAAGMASLGVLLAGKPASTLPTMPVLKTHEEGRVMDWRDRRQQ
jgi:hypothetical protein